MAASISPHEFRASSSSSSSSSFGEFEGEEDVEDVVEEVVEDMSETELCLLLDEQAGGALLACRSVIRMDRASTSSPAATSLLEHGFLVVDGAVSSLIAKAALDDVLEIDDTLTAPTLASDDSQETPYRTDVHAWLHREKPPLTDRPALARAYEALHRLGDDIARDAGARLRGGREVQLAVYRTSGRYARHRDALPLGADDDDDDDSNSNNNENDGNLTTQRRRLTIVLYLSSASPDGKDGGALRLYRPSPANGYEDVIPSAGCAVVFLSGAIDHEVLSLEDTGYVRAALTLWMH